MTIIYSSQTMVFIMGVNQLPWAENLIKGPNPEHFHGLAFIYVFLVHMSISYLFPDLSTLSALKPFNTLTRLIEAFGIITVSKESQVQVSLIY